MKAKGFIVSALFLCLCLVCTVTAIAHSGRTDGSGGHYNRTTGEYHWHHGYDDHQHYDIDGDGDLDCPITYTPTPTPMPTPKRTPTPTRTPTYEPALTFAPIPTVSLPIVETIPPAFRTYSSAATTHEDGNAFTIVFLSVVCITGVLVFVLYLVKK